MVRKKASAKCQCFIRSSLCYLVVCGYSNLPLNPSPIDTLDKCFPNNRFTLLLIQYSGPLSYQ